MLVDSNHAGDQVTRRSRTGFLVYLNKALIYWFLKKQTTIETSLFRSEFMAMKTGTEYLRGLRYKLRAMGIPVTKPVYIYGDNQSVLSNTKAPDSQLKKKSNSVAYHHYREGVALDEWRTCYLNTHDNIADMMTKPLPAGEKRSKFCAALFHFWKPRSEPSSAPSGRDRSGAATVSVVELMTKKGWSAGWDQAVKYFCTKTNL